MEYRITWMIDLEAESPEAAARQALAIHRDTQSLATIFDVTDAQGHAVMVDLATLPVDPRPVDPLSGHLALPYSGGLASQWWVDCAACGREVDLEMDGAGVDEVEAAVLDMGWHRVQRPGPHNADVTYICEACYTAPPDGAPAGTASPE